MYKKIFIFTVLGIALFCASPVFANGLEVVFESDPEPLFKEVNFLPGETVARWVDVTNNSGETKKIGLEIINNSPCSGTCLSDVLDLVISENGTTLYFGSLTTFYGAGEKILPDLNTGATTKYYFSMTFNPDAGDDYQNSTTNFDIKIGFFGEESIGEEIIPGGGGGGGGSIIVAGLTIFDENASDITVNETTITWETNYDSTSRVIYSPEGFPHLLQLTNPPNYGYVFSTDEDSNKVINHSVIITDLLSGTIYYFRCVSHGSLAITTEHSFTTLSVIGEQEEEEKEEEEIIVVEGETEEGVGEQEEEEEEEEEEKNGLLAIPGFVEIQEEVETGLSWLLAAIGDLFRLENLWWLLLLLIIIIIILYWLSRKKKRKGE